jgi:hypothetical protein
MHKNERVSGKIFVQNFFKKMLDKFSGVWYNGRIGARGGITRQSV